MAIAQPTADVQMDPQYRSIKPLIPSTTPGSPTPFTQGTPDAPMGTEPATNPLMAGGTPDAPIASEGEGQTRNFGGAITEYAHPNISTSQLGGATDTGGMTVPMGLPGGPSPLTLPGIDASQPQGDPSLRSDVYAPGNDPRLSDAQTATDTAAAGVQGTDRNAIQTGQESKYRDIYGTGAVAAGNAVGTDPSARTAAYGTAQDAALAALNGGPDRTDLANKTLSDFETQGGIDMANKFRDVGRTSAKFGRMGLGDVNSELGSIQGDYNRNLLQKRNELASSVAAGDIQDRLNAVNATSGLRSQEAGIDAGNRATTAADRAYKTSVDTGNADRGFARTNAALGTATDQTGARIADASGKLTAARTLEDQIAGQGANNRNEMRTERGYQAGAAQQSLENRLNERKQQQAEKDARLRQAMAQTQAGAA